MVQITFPQADGPPAWSNMELRSSMVVRHLFVSGACGTFLKVQSGGQEPVTSVSGRT